jgi:hypothetical protein
MPFYWGSFTVPTLSSADTGELNMPMILIVPLILLLLETSNSAPHPSEPKIHLRIQMYGTFIPQISARSSRIFHSLHQTLTKT